MIHDRLADAGADFMVLSGYEVPEWFADAGRVARARRRRGVATSPSTRTADEHRAVREAVGVMDMSFMASLLVQGPDALSACSTG